MGRHRSKESLLSRRGKGFFEESVHEQHGNGITKLWEDFNVFIIKVYEMGRSDPRQIFFAAKFGLALAIVSLLVYFHYISHHTIWAILTIVSHFEFSIGNLLFFFLLFTSL